MRIVFTSHGIERLYERSALSSAQVISQCATRLRERTIETWFDDGNRNLCARLSDGTWAIMRRGYKGGEYAIVTVLTDRQIRFNRNRWWSKSANTSTPATSDGFWKPFAGLLKKAK